MYKIFTNETAANMFAAAVARRFKLPDNGRAVGVGRFPVNSQTRGNARVIKHPTLDKWACIIDNVPDDIAGKLQNTVPDILDWFPGNPSKVRNE